MKSSRTHIALFSLRAERDAVRALDASAEDSAGDSSLHIPTPTPGVSTPGSGGAQTAAAVGVFLSPADEAAETWKAIGGGRPVHEDAGAPGAGAEEAGAGGLNMTEPMAIAQVRVK